MPTGIYGRCALHYWQKKLGSDFCSTPYCFVLRKAVPLLPQRDEKPLKHKGILVVPFIQKGGGMMVEINVSQNQREGHSHNDRVLKGVALHAPFPHRENA